MQRCDWFIPIIHHIKSSCDKRQVNPDLTTLWRFLCAPISDLGVIIAVTTDKQLKDKQSNIVYAIRCQESECKDLYIGEIIHIQSRVV
jgi:hypothetical protein